MRRSSLVLLTVGILAVASARRPDLLYGGQTEAVGQANRRTDRDIDIRLAKAKLDLAQAELAVVLEANQRTPGAVAKGDVERLESEVNRASSEYYKSDLRFAKKVAAIADAELQISLEANKNAPGAVNDLDLDRLRLTALVAHLQVEKLAGAHAVESRPAADLQSEVAELRSEVAGLRKSVHELLQKAKTTPEKK